MRAVKRLFNEHIGQWFTLGFGLIMIALVYYLVAVASGGEFAFWEWGVISFWGLGFAEFMAVMSTAAFRLILSVGPAEGSLNLIELGAWSIGFLFLISSVLGLLSSPELPVTFVILIPLAGSTLSVFSLMVLKRNWEERRQANTRLTNLEAQIRHLDPQP